jgi:hypothetical protein
MQSPGALPRFAGGLVVALALFMTVTLQAFTVELTATAACDEATGGFVITYTVQQSLSFPVSHPSVDVSFDGVVVDNDAINAPSFSFSDTLPAPAGKGAGDTVTVTVHFNGPWANGTQVGDEGVRVPGPVDVVLPEGCEPGTGRFTGGGFFIVDDVKITRGLTIHCDLLLSNNLEINWGNGQGAHQFHLLEHLTTIECSDDPDIAQPPPAAPLDTLVGIGTGRFDGEEGYTIEFTLVDGGEPGRGDDAMRILIYETLNPGNVILDIPLTPMNGGNLQAHADQPHKNGNGGGPQ